MSEHCSWFQGIEKKRSTLHGSEKGVVARHEAGHAVVGTAVAKFIPDLTRVQVWPIFSLLGHLLIVIKLLSLNILVLVLTVAFIFLLFMVEQVPATFLRCVSFSCRN